MALRLKWINTAIIAGVLAGISHEALAQFDPMGMARRALAEPFVGLTTDGTPERGLFEIKQTGVSTAPVMAAAHEFLSSLDLEKRGAVQFDVDDQEWRNWANIHRFPRKGLSLGDMTPTQREKAYTLLRTSLSAKGYKTSRDIIRLNGHLAELVSNFDEYGEHLYSIIIFGDPSAAQPWGWQIEGHHLIVNYFILGDQIVMTPTFMGSEPVSAESGKYAGTTVFKDEQDHGLAFVRSLPPQHRKAAIVGEKNGRSENISEMFKDNITVPYQGLPASRLSEPHRDKFLELIGLFVGTMSDGHAAVKMAEVRAQLDKTYFAWTGPTDPDAVFHYRIHSPVIWIEFDHQGPIALSGSRGVPTRRHVHTVVRTPNGNDYGKDLLRQHYLKHRDDPDHGHRER